MKKTNLHRISAFVLALLLLIGGSSVVVAAETTDYGSVTHKTLAEIKEQLNAISYEAYCQQNESIDRGTTPISVDVLHYKEFQNTANGAESVRVVNGADGNAEALYTPNTGTVTWTVNVPSDSKYSIVVEYWPDQAKSASIERILKINGKIPFAEARYLSFPKVWKNEYVFAQVRDPDGKVPVQEIHNKAIAAGFSAADTRIESDGSSAYVVLQFPSVWTESITEFVNEHEVRFFTSDIDRNELRPAMSQKPEWRVAELRDANGFYAETFEFAFEAGEQTISLEAVNEPMTIRSITLIPHEDLITYEAYLARYANVGSGEDWVTIQAEYFDATSSQTIYPIEDRTDAATMPSDTTRTVLNTVGGEKWQTAGQWIRYKFKVGSSGMYNIAARYRQNVLDGMYVCRSLRITSEGAEKDALGYYEGDIPFYEATQLRFNYDNHWQSTMLTDGEDVFEFYFEKDVEYTIEIEVTLGSMGDVVRRVTTALDAINKDYLDIMKLTGATPDKYRDYGFSRAMPDTLMDMVLQSRELYAVAAELEAITGEKSSHVATLEKVAWLLDRMCENGGEEIAKYLDQLKSYIGSLGTWLSDAKTQPLQLDYIVIQPLDGELPKAKAGFFRSLGHELSSFFMSFFRNYNRMGATSEESADENAIDVWLAYGRDQAQVIRNLINNDFTPVYDVPVNLKLVAGGTLLPSVLAGMGPDVYIGVGEDDVINYAIRGALVNIEEMDGFEDMLYYKYEHRDSNGDGVPEITKTRAKDANGKDIVNPNAQFNEAAMFVMGIDDAEGAFHYYGLPETQNFTMMFIRDDILADLGIEIPKTWDDILAAIPVLQANNMQIGMHTDYKIFLYQNGGELFADEGMRINLDSNVGLESFETMCNFFTMYSFPYKYDFANRFRTGEMPIGFASYNGTYNHLIVFATEIKGLWEFVPMPGVEQVDENGKSYINNVSVSTASAIVMLNGCKNYEDSWEFMKWHAGADCQIKYSNEMVAIIGPSAKHATANIQALSEMPWTSAEYEQLSYQFSNLASIPNYPGSYIIGRYTKFAYLAAFDDNADPITELQKYITTINKEITRKREEFGLETLELGQTLTEKRLDQVKAAFEEDTKKMAESKLDDAELAISMMNEAIKAEDAVTLGLAGEAFASVDSDAFAKTIAAIQKAVIVLSR